MKIISFSPFSDVNSSGENESLSLPVALASGRGMQPATCPQGRHPMAEDPQGVSEPQTAVSSQHLLKGKMEKKQSPRNQGSLLSIKKAALKDVELG